MTKAKKLEVDLSRFIWEPGNIEILSSKESRSIIGKDNKVKREMIETEKKQKAS